jgi:hypothetical protein
MIDAHGKVRTAKKWSRRQNASRDSADQNAERKMHGGGRRNLHPHCLPSERSVSAVGLRRENDAAIRQEMTHQPDRRRFF